MSSKYYDTVKVSELNLETLRGLVVGLTDNEIFWNLPTGSTAMELNRITGKVSQKVSKELTDYEVNCVLNGLKTGRLVVYKSVVTEKPAQIEDVVPSGVRVQARRLLDEHDVEAFGESLIGQPISVLKACLTLERNGLKRDKFVKVITGALS